MSYFYEFVVKYALEEMKGQEKRKPSGAELNKYFVDSGGPYKGFDNTTHWCGIFATYLLRKAGVQAKWTIGKLGGRIEDLSGGAHIKFIPGNEGITRGDIAVRGSTVHHFVVLEPVEKGVIKCVEGNYGGVGNPWLHHGLNYKNTVSEVDFYYRVY